MANIDNHLKAFNVQQQAALTAIFEAIITDLGSIDTSIDTLITKLNSDAGITDTDYANAASITTVT